jgi:uncharacterized protein YcbX
MSRQEASLACVAALWRYPVKSMLGEQLEQAEVTDSGIVGDRAYTLMHQHVIPNGTYHFGRSKPSDDIA